MIQNCPCDTFARVDSGEEHEGSRERKSSFIRRPKKERERERERERRERERERRKEHGRKMK